MPRIRFNRKKACFSIANDLGFIIYCLQPFKKARVCASRTFQSLQTGFTIVEMLDSTNLFAFVGNGKNPLYGLNKVLLWDDLTCQVLVEIEYSDQVVNLRLSQDFLIVVLSRFVYVYQIQSQSLNRLGLFETHENLKGTLSMSCNHLSVLAVPGRKSGQIQIIYFTNPLQIKILVAHNSPVACIALSNSGKLLASASEKGTLIRIWDVTTLTLLNEFRRGADRANIYWISFSSDESRIVVSSDKGTVHIFNLQLHISDTPSEIAGPASSSNRQSILSSVSSYLPKYFSSEWSFASFSLASESRCIVEFIESDMALRHKKDLILGPLFEKDETGILALCADGSLYKFRLDPKKGGECTMESFYTYSCIPIDSLDQDEDFFQ